LTGFTVTHLPDYRTGPNRRYEIADAALEAFAVFFTQSPSFLAYLGLLSPQVWLNAPTIRQPLLAAPPLNRPDLRLHAPPACSYSSTHCSQRPFPVTPRNASDPIWNSCLLICEFDTRPEAKYTGVVCYLHLAVSI